MPESINPNDRYRADFTVNPDGLVVHGNGPADGEYALKRAANYVDPERNADRPRVSTYQQGDYDGVMVESGSGRGFLDDPEACPRCHLRHDENLDDEKCERMVDEARRVMPDLDPDGEYTNVTIRFTSKLPFSEVRDRVSEFTDKLPSPITATVACEQRPFLYVVKEAMQAERAAQAAELLGAVQDLVETVESDEVVRAAEDIARKAANN